MTHFKSVEAVVKDLRAQLEERRIQPVGALVRVALRRGDELTFLVGMVHFHGEVVEPRQSREYPNALLLEDWFDVAHAIEWMVAALEGRAELCGHPVPSSFHDGHSEAHIAGSEDLCGWSSNTIKCAIAESTGYLGSDPVVTRGLPPYRNLEQAAREWVFDPFDWRWVGSIPFSGQLILVVPDTRGRIREAQLDYDQLRVTLDLGTAADDIELQALFLGSSPSRKITSAPVSRVELDVPPGAHGVDLYLLHKSDLLARVQLSPSRPLFNVERPLAPEPTDVGSDLAHGENDQVEFKPFVNPKGKKAQELVETVVAFANSEGGRLYVGVDDYGEPQGMAALHRCYGNVPPEDALERARRDLVKLISDKTKPVPVVVVESFFLDEDPIVLVHVSPGERRPYSTFNNHVFVRRGGTNKRPDPQTEFPLASNTLF